MMGIASGKLTGLDDRFEPDRVARGNIDAIRLAGLPQYGNVYNIEFYRQQRDQNAEAAHIAELLRDC